MTNELAANVFGLLPRHKYYLLPVAMTTCYLRVRFRSWQIMGIDAFEHHEKVS